MPDRTDDPSHDRRSARRAEGGEDRTQAEWAPGPGERAAREERGPGSPERGGSRDEWAPGDAVPGRRTPDAPRAGERLPGEPAPGEHWGRPPGSAGPGREGLTGDDRAPQDGTPPPPPGPAGAAGSARTAPGGGQRHGTERLSPGTEGLGPAADEGFTGSHRAERAAISEEDRMPENGLGAPSPGETSQRERSTTESTAPDAWPAAPGSPQSAGGATGPGGAPARGAEAAPGGTPAAGRAQGYGEGSASGGGFGPHGTSASGGTAASDAAIAFGGTPAPDQATASGDSYGQGGEGSPVSGGSYGHGAEGSPVPGGTAEAGGTPAPGVSPDQSRAAAPAPGGTTGPASAEAAPLMAREEAEEWEQRMRHVVGGFVDEPRAAVEEADRALEEIAARFSEAVTRRRRTLRMSWEGGEERGTGADTEQLRLALRDYRELAGRLLHG
ncbi:hypothetical protein ACH4PW_33065 [Streptomyces sp. NPDC017082]|uniref:hypothetical protein n=1 Tax=Streptomyces sp. NPDC017082 TaxID=3364974 RepID=UPI0037B8C780